MTRHGIGKCRALLLALCTGLGFGQGVAPGQQGTPPENPPDEQASLEGTPSQEPAVESSASDGATKTASQTGLPNALQNGSMEKGDPGQALIGWKFLSNIGAEGTLVTEEPFEGRQAAKIDASSPGKADSPFTNLMQTLDATSWRGKRVRFRAAVKVADLKPGTTVQLWLRVDRAGNRMGAFDNMGDRPIQDETWTPHEIVVDVADDAVHLVLGMFVVGAGTAWMDDASLETVGEEVPTTGGATAVGGWQMPEAVREAMAVADKAPRQPFFTLWLILPALGILLSLIAFWPTRDVVDPETSPNKGPGKVRRFAIRFAIAYWVLYALPGPFLDVLRALPAEVTRHIPEWSSNLQEGHQWLDLKLVSLTAKHGFGITGDLVPPNGSGDTTHNYLSALNGLVLAFTVALIWSLVRGPRLRHRVLLDLLRSYLRYVLAFAMLGYGLAKVSMEANQFPPIGDWQMAKTWGDSSPMNVVWAFMGSSRPYTIFAGLSEVLASLLLIWRRTSTLGALVAIGVMTNVVMLNYCFDVPVKLYSTHLLLMGVLIALPDIGRLFRLIVLNRPVGSSGWADAWSGRYLKWVRWPLKLAVIALCIGVPVYKQGKASYGNMVDAIAAHGEDASAGDDDRPLLVRRGYRWINEVPFNR